MTYTGYKGPDLLSAQLLDKLNEFVEGYNSQHQRLIAADGDKDKAIQLFMESSDHKDAIRLRKAIETAQQKLQELAESSVVVEEISEDEKTKIKTYLDETKLKISSARKAIENVASNMSEDPDGVRAALVSIGNPTGLGTRGRPPGSPGSSLPRVRASVTINGGDFDNKVFEQFSKAAVALNCEVKDLQLAFAEAAGVEHKNLKTVRESVTFKFQPNDNGEVYTITTHPTVGNKPGPKPKQSAPGTEPVAISHETEDEVA